jgi:acyl-homoserine lactone acylase PvdQ
MRGSIRSAAAATLFACVALVASARGQDFSYDILPPGQYGNLPTTVHSTDQLLLYDSLTPLRGNVSVDDIERLYKPEDFEPNGATTSVETGRPGLTILRDSFGVPFIYCTTLDDIWFGVGFVTAQDRALLLRLGRGAARAIVADIPGVDPLMLLINASSFVPSAQTAALVTAQQQKLVRAYGSKGRQILRDLAAYADGVTAGFLQSGGLDRPWTVNDAIAITAFIGSIFGNGGGDEVRNSEFLARLRAQLGAKRGSQAFVDLMAANDPESPVTMRRRFFYGVSGGNVPRGSLLVDPGSVQLAAPGVPRRLASNFLVASPQRSATRETLFVAGPQLGYSYPPIVLEASLHGPGLLAQGALVPGGGPYLLIGRTTDYAWSLTTAMNDNRDQILVELCEPNGSEPTRRSRFYRHQGACRAMDDFDAGTLDGVPVSFGTTVYGPVQGTVTVRGKPYAITLRRSTYAQDGLSLAALRDMTLGRAQHPANFFRAANEFGFTFNWVYANRRRTAYFSSGLLPRRAPETNKLLPARGNGQFDWTAFLQRLEHPHTVGGPNGLFRNWNNKPAPLWQTGDDNHSYQSIQRVVMYDGWPRRARIEDVVSIMNRAATEDLRATRVWPVINRVLSSGPAPDALTAQAADLVTAWGDAGGSVLDSDLDGFIDAPGAAVMEAAWDRLADAVLSPVLGPLVDELAELVTRHDSFGYEFGWYGYVDKDLRTLLGDGVRGRYKLRYCGRGVPETCRASLWAAMQQASAELAVAQGPDPTAWRTPATRIQFIPGFIPDTMRFTNRSTFQQVIRFARRRP